MFDWWLAKRAPSKRTKSDMESIIRAHLRPALGRIKLRDFDISSVEQFILDRGHLNYKTVGNHITLLVTMLRAARDELKWISELPRIKKPKNQVKKKDKRHRILRDNAEIARFLNAAQAESEYVYVFYATAIYTGMRAGELAGLRWSNVDLETKTISVEWSFDREPKTENGYRDIPIFDVLLPVLR